jgi:hypothetical protein
MIYLQLQENGFIGATVSGEEGRPAPAFENQVLVDNVPDMASFYVDGKFYAMNEDGTMGGEV